MPCLCKKTEWICNCIALEYGWVWISLDGFCNYSIKVLWSKGKASKVINCTDVANLFVTPFLNACYEDAPCRKCQYLDILSFAMP